MARIEGCFPRDLQEQYAIRFTTAPVGVGWVPNTQGVAFRSDDVIQTITRFTTKQGSGLRLRSYNLRGQELDARDFEMPRLRRSTEWLLFRNDPTLIAFSESPREQGVYRFVLGPSGTAGRVSRKP